MVDSYDYSSGAPMVFINLYDSGTNGRRATTYDGDSADAPKLHIEYTVAGAAEPSDLTLMGVG